MHLPCSLPAKPSPCTQLLLPGGHFPSIGHNLDDLWKQLPCFPQHCSLTHSLNPIKSNGVRLSSPLLSMASFQPDSLKLPYPPKRQQRSSKTPRFISTSSIPACQGLIGMRAKPALRFANCCRRGTSTPCTTDDYFLAQQFWVLQGVRFYENSPS